MTRTAIVALAVLGAASIAQVPAAAQIEPTATASRLQKDLAAIERFRPGHSFWQHIFTIPDGSIAYGSALDGRLLAVFPTKGDWTGKAVWKDPSLAGLLDGHRLPARLTDRREQVASILERAAGPVLHNPTRGRFLLPNISRYGRFLGEWGAIYERFGVPAEVGLAQVIIESGLDGKRRSEARAVGFCQWLERNWRRMNQLSPEVIEGRNQTTQAPYCAAYLTILAAKYGSFIPALSEHHSGGTNVGRTLINGERLGGEGVREQYFMGAQLARDLRGISLMGYRDIYRTYGPRSYRYAEMVFGNTPNVRRITGSTRQAKIYAMRVGRSVPLAEITRRTRLSADEVRRFNPALVKQVPRNATLYLPFHVKAFGPDVSFWHRPIDATYASVLDDFLSLDVAPEQWTTASFETLSRKYQRRFRATNTEEGAVMATVLAYATEEARTGGRGAILDEFRSSRDVRRLLAQGVLERDALRASQAAAEPDAVPAASMKSCVGDCQ